VSAATSQTGAESDLSELAYASYVTQTSQQGQKGSETTDHANETTLKQAWKAAQQHATVSPEAWSHTSSLSLSRAS